MTEEQIKIYQNEVDKYCFQIHEASKLPYSKDAWMEKCSWIGDLYSGLNNKGISFSKEVTLTTPLGDTILFIHPELNGWKVTINNRLIFSSKF